MKQVETVSNHTTIINDIPETDTFPKCKICFLHKNPIDSSNDLIAPCGCKGSIKYVHKTCLRLWRFKGKHIREIKRCEQCCHEYKIDEDYIPHKMVVSMSCIATIGILMITCNFLINSCYDAMNYLIEDDEVVCYDTFFKQLKENDFRHGRNIMDERLDFTIRHTIVIVLLVYVFLCCWSFWPVLNFYFTAWRVFQFSYGFDKVILAGLCGYYLKRMYKDLYGQIDALYVFLLNYKS